MDWPRVREIFDRALAEPATERDAFVHFTCQGNPALEAEVFSLLRADLRAGSFLDLRIQSRPARRSLSHYEIESELGRGGMGVVCRACDTHLQRTVAIKVLNPSSAADPDHRRRLLEEARAASALNHPNIITIFDVNRDGEVDFIAMEYVEGVTLASAIRRGLEYGKAFEIALQIVGALAAAHATGIVHCDIKPSNIMLTPIGLVKVLDFGLGKRTTNSNNPAPERDAALTRDGAVFGTPSYMAPEQLAGQKASARSDVFSLGIVLSELFPANRSPELSAIIDRCRNADPALRFVDAGVLQLALQELERPSRSRWPGTRILTVAVLAILILAAAISRIIPRTGSADPHPLAIQLTWNSGLATDPAISPDGRTLAYASTRGGPGVLNIWQRDLKRGTERKLVSNGQDNTEPSFSPDGSCVVFRSERNGGGIYAVPTSGGAEVLVAARGRRPRFSPDGKWIAYWEGTPGTGDYSRSGVYVVPAAGGEPVRIQPSFREAHHPVWSPDSQLVLFEGAPNLNSGDPDCWLAPVDGSAPVATSAYGRFKAVTAARLPLPEHWRPATGDVIFTAEDPQGATLWSVPINKEIMPAAGVPRKIAYRSGERLHPSVSSDGHIIFSSESVKYQLWTIPLAANDGVVAGKATQLTPGIKPDQYPSLSADGTKLLLNRRESALLKDFATGRERVLLRKGQAAWSAISGNGLTVFAQREGNVSRLRVADGLVETICTGCTRPWHVSSDGRYLLTQTATVPMGIAVLDTMLNRKRNWLVSKDWPLYAARFSKDDHWVAFEARVGPGAMRIFIVPFDPDSPIPAEQWIQVTDGTSEDGNPAWSPDGRRLYFSSRKDGHLCLYSQALPGGSPTEIYHFHDARRGLGNVLPPDLEITVGAGKLVTTLGERTGEIFMIQ